MDLRVADFAKADQVFFYTESTSAPLNEVVYFYPSGLATINAAAPTIKTISFVYSLPHFVGDMC